MSHIPPAPIDMPPLMQIGHRVVQDGATVAGWLGRALEALAFWTAVLLPLVYLPLFVGGIGGQEPVAVGGLLLMNLLALIAGHDYAREPTS